jgi:OOP family OmpA-OmpF porin
LTVHLALLMLFVLTTPAGHNQHETARTMEAEINRTGAALVYGITFERDTATLEPQSEKVLQEIVLLMRGHTDWRFEVQGHTSGNGAPAADLAASGQRAKAVVAWLVSRGMAADRLQPKGYGDSRPVSAGTGDEARALNVRVQLRKLNEE